MQDRFSRLVRSAQVGDAAASERLFQHYRDKLYQLARARLGSGRDYLEVSDVLQTTLRRAVRSFSGLQPTCDEAVDAWFRQILENAIRDHHRRHHAQRRGEGRAPVSLERSDADGTVADGLAHPDAEQGASALEKDELAAGVWRLLSPEERALVQQKVLDDSSWDEVARAGGAASADAARKRFEALRKRLQERLGRDYGEDSLRSD